MDEFCTDLLRFAMDHNYRPEVEWKRYKTKLSSFDVRHLVWSIAIRLGLGKGKGKVAIETVLHEAVRELDDLLPLAFLIGIGDLFSEVAGVWCCGLRLGAGC